MIARQTELFPEDSLSQPGPVQAAPFAERVRNVAGRRTLSFGLAFLIESLLLFLLLTLGREERPGTEDGRPTEVTLVDAEITEEAQEARRPEPEQKAAERPETQPPQPDKPSPPKPPEPAVALPAPETPIIVLPRKAEQPAPSARPLYGPPDRPSPAFRDTERVGTAPNGEPLYAAQWYREPADAMLRAYLSSSRGPGWGLIACRTAPDYRVEDCVALSEYPEGSQITRSVLAAAWEFRVRPPRLGGRPLVGSWVRIRIDYGLERR